MRVSRCRCSNFEPCCGFYRMYGAKHAGPPLFSHAHCELSRRRPSCPGYLLVPPIQKNSEPNRTPNHHHHRKFRSVHNREDEFVDATCRRMETDVLANKLKRSNPSMINRATATSSNCGGAADELSQQLRQEAITLLQHEPELSVLLYRTVLADGVKSLEDAVAWTVCYRLLSQSCDEENNHRTCAPQTRNSLTNGNNNKEQTTITPITAMYSPKSLCQLFLDCMHDTTLLEAGHDMSEAIRKDALAVCRRDPATETLLEVILFCKGYAALVCHRAAHRLWKYRQRKFTALFLQSQASTVFGLDIHPLAVVGCSVMFDHGTGVVVGETAQIGDGCTILHGVTLGGTGKQQGDRHPKVGKNVLIGAGASLLGNIQIGDGSKIGAGSVVLRNIVAGATAVGVPAKIIGRAGESQPGSEMDETLENVSLLHKSVSAAGSLESYDSSADLSDILEEEHAESRGDSVCPYRKYQRLAITAPKGSITFGTLQKILQPFGCTHSEIGAVLFDMDSRNVGYVYVNEFRERSVDVILKNTSLKDRELVENLINEYLQTHQKLFRQLGCDSGSGFFL